MIDFEHLLGKYHDSFLGKFFSKHPTLSIIILIVLANVIFFFPRLLGFIFGTGCLLGTIYLAFFAGPKGFWTAIGGSIIGKFAVTAWIAIMFASVGILGFPSVITFTSGITIPLLCPEGYQESIRPEIITRTETKNPEEGSGIRFERSHSMEPVCVGGLGEHQTDKMDVFLALTVLYMAFAFPLILLGMIKDYIWPKLFSRL